MIEASGSHLIDVDPITGKRRVLHYDAVEDKFTVETVQPVDDLIASNKALFNEAPERMGGEMIRVASIPLNIYFQLKQEGVIDDPARLKKWLNDPDNRAFRTRPGRV